MKEIKLGLETSNDSDTLLVLEGDFNYKKQIKDILENFDFEYVRKSMVSLDWKWVTSDLKSKYIPDIQELKETAKLCLEHAIESTFSQTGGFLAANCSGVLNLYFVLEETMNDFSNLKNVKIYEKSLNKEKILKKIKHG